MVTGANKNRKIVSLNVRGIRDPTKRRTILVISKTKRHPSTFYKKLIPKALTKMSGGTNGEERFSFPVVANTAEVYAFLAQI